MIVVGGGHAGLEAAHAASRRGARVQLVTLDSTRVGEMSCNPAVGGLGKGHLVREVDALDGVLGRIADASGIQFRLLNRRKGPAVRGPRAQCDRDLFKRSAQAFLAIFDVNVIEGEVVSLLITQGRIRGVLLGDGTQLSASAVVLTTGTFLGGVVHIGEQSWSAGRAGEAAADQLSSQMREAAFGIGRLKTGTPPRLVASSIDWDRLEKQPGDNDPCFLSFETRAVSEDQVPCHITYTAPKVHDVIRDNLRRSAMHAGAISGLGPRYCPSIEDKISRFADKDSHQIFLEPEGLRSDLVYPNGISTSLPADVQEAFVREIPGLEHAIIRRPGYAIEYDFVDPRSLTHELQHREVEGLFLAGQVNGTTGYEEAAAQGVLAGANAAARALHAEPLRIDRATGYLGVMVDDLVTMGVTEPYRMFTSRAEYRLRLRIDNADERLTGIGRSVGLVGDERWVQHQVKMEKLERGRTVLHAMSVTPKEAVDQGIAVRMDGVRRDGFALLSLRDVSFGELTTIEPELSAVEPEIAELLEIEAGYAAYLDRQADDIARLQADEAQALSPDISYEELSGLSSELRSKLTEQRPATVAVARRIEGMTPAALLLVLSANKSAKRDRPSAQSA